MNAPNANGFRWNPAARLDLYAVGLSTLCVLHCVALPVLLAVMPVAAQAAESELVHRILVIVAVPVSLRVIWKARPMNGNRLFVGAVSVGLGLLMLGAFMEAVSAYEGCRSPLPAARSWHRRIFGTGCDNVVGVAATDSL